MVTIALWIAVMRITLRERVRPYLRRYGYRQAHTVRAVKRELRHQVGNVDVVRAAWSVGYAARMSYIAEHTGEVYA